MIDPSFDTTSTVEITPGSDARITTHDLLQIQYAEIQKSLEQKIKDHEYVSGELRRRVAQINSFESALKDNEWDFDQDTLESLADFFGIELNREYDVTITVRWSGTVTAPMNFDMDDIENFLDIRIDTDYRTSDATIDLYQDDFEIDYTEA